MKARASASAEGAEYESQGKRQRRRRGIWKPGASAEQREARRPWYEREM